MAVLLLQFICAALFAMGLFFIGIELRVRYDRSNLYFGSSLLVLCGIAGVDLWILPQSALYEELFWTRTQHVFVVLFSVFLNLYLMRLSGGKLHRFVQALLSSSLAVGVLTCTPWVLTLKGGEVVTQWGYTVFFIPYLLFICISVVNWLFIQSRHAEVSEKKVLRLHLIGLIILASGGFIDAFVLGFKLHVLDYAIPSFTAVGVLGYGLCASGIFAERFFFLLREKDALYRKLESAYVDMEKAGRLKQLGESTAMINHEIKNYMFLISGNAQMLQEFESLSPKGQSIVDNIISAVDRLTRFSKDILELSRTHLLKESYPVVFTDLVRRTCLTHFSDRKEFLLLRLENDIRIHGDPDKLEQMLVNLIQNAFEATRPGELPDLRLTLRQTEETVLLTIEDFGTGCAEENLQNLFKAFHTTKRGKGGNGLGMSLSRTIVEGHGGKINAYSKNFDGEDSHGLIVNLAFPRLTEKTGDDLDVKAPLVLVPEGMEDLESLLRVLNNVGATPFVVGGIEELHGTAVPLGGKTILLSSRSKHLNQLKPHMWRQVALITSHHHQLYLTGEVIQGRTELLTENVVLDLIEDARKPKKPAGKPTSAPSSESTKSMA